MSRCSPFALLSYAVANPYDTPTIEQAKAVAEANNASITVFDANNSPQTQFSQLQDIVASGKYQGVLAQPINGPQLIPAVQEALKAGVKVAAFDQILGPDKTTADVQVPGVTTSVSLILLDQVADNISSLIVDACASKNLNPCNVGYIWGVKAADTEQYVHKAIMDKLASHPEIKVVAEGESEYQQSVGLKSAQDMLTAHPEINLFYAPEQGVEGAMQASQAIGKKPGQDMLFVAGGGGSHSLENVKNGNWYGLSWSAPGTSAKLATEQLIQGIRENKTFPGSSVVTLLPDNGRVTKDNAGKFTSEYEG
jgi:ribose transport system substrate-binding protein